MQIYFAIPLFLTLDGDWGNLFLNSKLRNFYRIINQTVEIIANISGQFLTNLFQLYSVNITGSKSVNDDISDRLLVDIVTPLGYKKL